MTPVGLDALLEADRACDPITVDRLTNHRPMSLIALHRLGADDERLAEHAATYDRIVAPLRHEIASSAASISSDLGHNGITATTDRIVGSHADGVGGAAFHGLIRLGYALDHGGSADIALAAANLIDDSQPIDLARERHESADRVGLTDVLARLRAEPSLRDRSFRSNGFARRFDEVAGDPAFRRIAADLDPAACTIGAIAATALALYRSSHNFFALHTVTATHAARVTAAAVASDATRQQLALGLAEAVAAAYVVIGAPAIEPPSLIDSVPEWPDIIAAAIASDDAHVLKMVYSCRSEQDSWGDDGYRTAAADVVANGPG